MYETKTSPVLFKKKQANVVYKEFEELIKDLDKLGFKEACCLVSAAQESFEEKVFTHIKKEDALKKTNFG